MSRKGLLLPLMLCARLALVAEVEGVWLEEGVKLEASELVLRH